MIPDFFIDEILRTKVEILIRITMLFTGISIQNNVIVLFFKMKASKKLIKIHSENKRKHFIH